MNYEICTIQESLLLVQSYLDFKSTHKHTYMYSPMRELKYASKRLAPFFDDRIWNVFIFLYDFLLKQITIYVSLVVLSVRKLLV